MTTRDTSQVYRVIDIFYHGIVISNKENVMRLSDYDLTVKGIDSKELFNSIHPGDKNVNKDKHSIENKKRVIIGGDHNHYEASQLFYPKKDGKNIRIMETHPEQTDITKWSVKLHIDKRMTIGSDAYNKYYSVKGKPTTYYKLKLNDKVLVDLTKSKDNKIWITYKDVDNIESFSKLLFDVKEYPIVTVADNVIIMNGENESESKSIFLSRDRRTGLYRVAGGHVEKGESNTEGSSRELGEETRLNLKDIESSEYKVIEVERHLLSSVQESRRGVVLYLILMKDPKNMQIDNINFKISFVDQNKIEHNLTWDSKNAFPRENFVNLMDNNNNIKLSYYTEDVLIETIKAENNPVKYHYFKHNYLLYEHGNDKYLYRAVGDMVDKHTMISAITYRYLKYNKKMKDKLYLSGDITEPLISQFLSIEKYNDLKNENLFHWNTHIGLIDRGILYASEIIKENKLITMNNSDFNTITFKTNKIGKIFVAYNSTIPEQYDYDFYIRRNKPHNNTHYYVILDSDDEKGYISIDDAMVNLNDMLKNEDKSLFAVELLSDIADGMCYIKRLIKVPDSESYKKSIAEDKQIYQRMKEIIEDHKTKKLNYPLSVKELLDLYNLGSTSLLESKKN